MTVERGGIRFPIEVVDKLDGFERFDAAVEKATKTWDAFVARVSSLNDRAESAAGRMRALAEASKELAAAQKETARAKKESAAASREEEGAEAALERRMRRRALNAEVLALADERRIDISTRQTQQYHVEEQALQELIEEEFRAAVSKRKLQIAEQLGIETSKKVKKALTEQEEAQKKLDKIVRNRVVQEELARLAAERGIELSRKKVQQFNAEEQAARRAAKAQQELSVQQALAAKGLDARGRPVLLPGAASVASKVPDTFNALLNPGAALDQVAQFQKTPAFLSRLRSEIAAISSEAAKADDGLKQFLYTFRRLAGVFAVFQGVRIAFNGVVQSLREAVGFSAQVEQSITGIASVIAAVAEVRNPLGQVVDVARELALAQEEARRQVVQLRLEALRTSATFEELAETFQVAVGPGLQAGLTLDQIRKFTVRISQSAAAIGLPQNQLAEEIRSLLTGTIQARTTRIATTLNITNDDIARAREAGRLAELLEDRFSAFAASAESASKNFSILFANLRDGFQQLLGEAAKGLFQELKGLLTDVNAGLIEVSETGIEINPRAVRIVESVLRGVESLVATARSLFREISTESLLAIGTAIGNILSAIGGLLGAVLPAVIDVTASLASVVNLLSGAVRFVTDLVGQFEIVNKLLGGALGFVLRWYATFRLLASLVPLLVSGFSAMRQQIAASAVSLGLSGGGVGGLLSLLSPLTAIAGAATLLGLAMVRVGYSTDEAGKAVEESRKRFSSFAAAVEQVGASFVSPSKGAQENAEIVRALEKDYRKAATALRDLLSAGGTGAALDALEGISSATEKIAESSKQLDAERAAAAERASSVEARRVGIERRIGELRTIDRTTLDAIVDTGRELLRTTEAREEAERRLVGLTGVELSQQEGRVANLRAAEDALRSYGEELLRSGGIQTQGPRTVGVLDIGRSERFVESKKILEVAQDLLRLDRDGVALREELLRLDRERARVVAGVLAAEFTNRARALVQGQRALEVEVATLAAQERAAEIRTRAARADRASGFGASDVIRRLAAAEAENEIAREKARVQAAASAQEIRASEGALERTRELVRQLEASKELADSDRDRAEIQTAIEAGLRASAAQEERIVALRRKSDAERLATEAAILATTKAAFEASEVRASATFIEGRARVLAAREALRTEQDRSRAIGEQERRLLAVSEVENRLRQIREDLSAERARADAERLEEAQKARTLTLERDALLASRDSTAERLRALGLSEDQVAASEEILAASRAIASVEAEIAQSRTAAIEAASAERLRAASAAREALNAIRLQATEAARLAEEQARETARSAQAADTAARVRELERQARGESVAGLQAIVSLESDLAAARERLELLRQSNTRQEALLEGQVAAATALEESLRIQAAAAGTAAERLEIEARINAAMGARAALEGQLQATRRSGNEALKADIAKVTDTVAAAFEGLRQEAIRGVRASGDAALRAEAEIAASRQVRDARESLLAIEKQIAAARADLSVQEKAVEIDRQRRDLAQEALEIRLRTAREALGALPSDGSASGVDTQARASLQETIVSLEQQLLEVRRQNTAELELQKIKTDELRLKLETLRMIEEQPVKAGALVAFRQLYEEATNTFQFTLDFTKQAITGFASSVSGILTDALDPSKEVDVKERFRQFFLGLLTSITNFLVTLGLVTLALSAIPGFKESLQLVAAFNGASGGSVGLAEGGPVPSAGRASPAHFAKGAGRRGFARGGRPRGLDPRDTVPIWVQPGEYVLRKDAVDRVGVRTIEALNRGLIDPGALSNSPQVTPGTPRGPGFRTGGLIPSAVVPPSAAAPAPAEERIVVVPVLVAGEEEVDRLLTGGPNALKRHLSRHRGATGGSVRGGRGA